MATDVPATTEQINALLRGADAGEPKALAELRQLCEEAPEAWREFGDLARNARLALVGRVAGKNAVVREAVARQIGQLRAELAGPAPTPLERLLVDRILANWLFLHYVETSYAQQLHALTLAQGDYHQRRIDRAHRRYLASIKALAQVRRLLTPAVQVNIAERQINVAS